MTIRGRENSILSFALALLGLSGCASDGDDVSVGRSSRAINPDVCFPAGSDCSASSRARSAAFDARQRCQEGRPFEATRIELPGLPEGFVDQHVYTGKAAPDGTLWVEAYGYPTVLPRDNDEIAMHVFLYQIDQQGKQLGVVGIPVNVDSQESTLMIDPEGTVTVADGSGRFRRYGANAKPLDMSEQVQWLRAQYVQADATTGYVIAGESTTTPDTAILSRFRKDGSLERSNNRISALSNTFGLRDLASDPRAGYSLLLKQPDTDESYRVVRFNHELTQQWFLPLPPEMSVQYPHMVSVGEGRLVINGARQEAAGNSAVFYGVDVDGASTFAFDFDVPSEPGYPFAAEQGRPKVWGIVNIFEPNVVVPVIGGTTDSGARHVVEIDAAEGTCQTHDLSEIGSQAPGTFMVTPDGTVFLLASGALFRLHEVADE